MVPEDGPRRSRRSLLRPLLSALLAAGLAAALAAGVRVRLADGGGGRPVRRRPDQRRHQPARRLPRHRRRADLVVLPGRALRRVPAAGPRLHGRRRPQAGDRPAGRARRRHRREDRDPGRRSRDRFPAGLRPDVRRPLDHPRHDPAGRGDPEFEGPAGHRRHDPVRRGPAGHHVGPGDAPGSSTRSPTSARPTPRSCSSTASGPTWTTCSAPASCDSRKWTDRTTGRRTGSRPVPRRHRGAGLRHLRAVEVGARGAGLGQAAALPAGGRLRLPQLPQPAGDPVRRQAAAGRLPAPAGADTPAVHCGLHGPARPGRSARSCPSSTRPSRRTPTRPPGPSRRSRSCATPVWSPTAATRVLGDFDQSRVNRLLNDRRPDLHRPAQAAQARARARTTSRRTSSSTRRSRSRCAGDGRPRRRIRSPSTTSPPATTGSPHCSAPSCGPGCCSPCRRAATGPWTSAAAPACRPPARRPVRGGARRRPVRADGRVRPAAAGPARTSGTSSATCGTSRRAPTGSSTWCSPRTRCITCPKLDTALHRIRSLVRPGGLVLLVDIVDDRPQVPRSWFRAEAWRTFGADLRHRRRSVGEAVELLRLQLDPDWLDHQTTDRLRPREEWDAHCRAVFPGAAITTLHRARALAWGA